MSDQFDYLEGPELQVVCDEPARISKTKTYQWEDCLGQLPPRPMRLNLAGKNLWLEELHQDGWFRVARRKNRRWVSLFSNLRIEQKTPEDPIDLVKI